MRFILIFFLSLIISNQTLAQKSMQLISSFAKFLEEKSDKKLYPDNYHFSEAFIVKESTNNETKNFYILVDHQNKYFGMSSNLNEEEVLLFDIQLDQLILFCYLENEQFAISGPLSFFDTNNSKNKDYQFTKIEKDVYQDAANNLKIELTNKKEFDNYGLKKGFWMIIQESSTLQVPLSQKGVILNLEKLNQNSSYSIIGKEKINLNFSVQNCKLLDFNSLADSTLNKN